MAFVAIKMGRRQGARSGAYLNRYVTDEQRGRRPIFIATLRAVVSWLFFRVAHSSRINSDMLVVRALKNSQLTGGDVAIICETVHEVRTSYACEYLSNVQAENMNGRLLEIGRLLNGMIERSSAFVIGDDRVREDSSIDEFF